MATLTGAAGATFIICNGLQRAFNFNPKWLALIIAILIAFFGVYETSDNRLSDYIIGLINGFLIFCTAGGAAELGSSQKNIVNTNAAVPKGAGQAKNPPPVKVKREFNSSWFH